MTSVLPRFPFVDLFWDRSKHHQVTFIGLHPRHITSKIKIMSLPRSIVIVARSTPASTSRSALKRTLATVRDAPVQPARP